MASNPPAFIFCSECGTKCTEGMFCSGCGSKLEIPLRDPNLKEKSTSPSRTETQSERIQIRGWDDEDADTKEAKRVGKIVDNAQKGSWDKPAVVVTKSYKPVMSGEEEMAMLRRRRKELEEKLRREGKL